MRQSLTWCWTLWPTFSEWFSYEITPLFVIHFFLNSTWIDGGHYWRFGAAFQFNWTNNGASALVLTKKILWWKMRLITQRRRHFDGEIAPTWFSLLTTSCRPHWNDPHPIGIWFLFVGSKQVDGDNRHDRIRFCQENPHSTDSLDKGKKKTHNLLNPSEIFLLRERTRRIRQEGTAES